MVQPPETSTNWKEVSWKHILKDIAQNKDQAAAPTGRPTQQQMIKGMQSYIDRLNGIEHEGTQNLFADSFTLEDPIGTQVASFSKGFPAEAFQDGGVKFTMLRAELVSPISTTYSNQAAMAFKGYMQVGDQEVSLDIVDVMTFDEEGKILEVKAFWGRNNVQVVERGATHA